MIDAAEAVAPLGRARNLFRRSAPRTPHAHLLESEEGWHLLVPNGNRLFDVDTSTYASLEQADDAALQLILADLGTDATPMVDDQAPERPPLRALSLAVAQKCNLGCTYCYAQQGDFGGTPKQMPLATALAAVDLLFRDVTPGERVNLTFLGGEPLLNRPVIRAATEAAAGIAEDRHVDLTFSLTTNGTLLRPDDAEFFERHGFAVTVSLDGLKEAHDGLRPFESMRGSFDTVMANVTPLLAAQCRMQVSARVTVTPRNLALQETLDAFVTLASTRWDSRHSLPPPRGPTRWPCPIWL